MDEDDIQKNQVATNAKGIIYMAKYCSQLTKEMLTEKYGIKALTWDEQSHKWIISKDSTRKSPGCVFRQFVSTRKHKYTPNKVYECVNVYDKETKQMKSLSLARVVYAWHYGVPEGMDVDHIDNNPHNNALDNLQLLTRKENIAKRYEDNKGKMFKNQYTINVEQALERLLNSGEDAITIETKISELQKLISRNKGE